MSLLDELIGDLEEMDDDEDQPSSATTTNADSKMEIDSSPRSTRKTTTSDVHSVAKLKDSLLLGETMRKIDFYTKHQRTSTSEIEGLVEHDPEYLLIVDANNLLVEIDNEIDIVHNFVRNIYRQRFPELEQLVQLPLDYLKTVQVSSFSLLSFFDRLSSGIRQSSRSS